MKSLEGTKLKVIRAREQIETFRGEIELFFNTDPKPCKLIPVGNSKPPREFTYHLIKNPPAKWGVIVGEIAHNLRSALDHLAWQLALLKTENPSSRTEFPIFNSKTIFSDEAKGVKNKWKDIPVHIHPVIESCQPYNREKRPLVGLLWCLHEINRVDKHRDIVPCFIQPRYSFNDADDIGIAGKRLCDEDKIKIIQHESTAKLKIKAEVAFDISGFEFPFPAIGLLGIHRFINEEVIPSFEVFFK